MSTHPTSPKKINWLFIVTWLFVLSVIAIPISWYFFNSYVLLWSLITCGVLLVVEIILVLIDDYRTKKHAETVIKKCREYHSVKVLLVLMVFICSCAGPRHITERKQQRVKAKMVYARSHPNKQLPTWLKLYWSVLQSIVIASSVQSK